jgi:hypothetical protein
MRILTTGHHTSIQALIPSHIVIAALCGTLLLASASIRAAACGQALAVLAAAGCPFGRCHTEGGGQTTRQTTYTKACLPLPLAAWRLYAERLRPTNLVMGSLLCVPHAGPCPAFCLVLAHRYDATNAAGRHLLEASHPLAASPPSALFLPQAFPSTTFPTQSSSHRPFTVAQSRHLGHPAPPPT